MYHSTACLPPLSPDPCNNGLVPSTSYVKGVRIGVLATCVTATKNMSRFGVDASTLYIMTCAVYTHTACRKRMQQGEEICNKGFVPPTSYVDMGGGTHKYRRILYGLMHHSTASRPPSPQIRVTTAWFSRRRTGSRPSPAWIFQSAPPFFSLSGL